VNRGTDFDDRASDTFPEAGLVTELFRNGSGADEYDLMAESIDFKDFACMAVSSLSIAGLGWVTDHIFQRVS
jgi:hypothetical protein